MALLSTPIRRGGGALALDGEDCMLASARSGGRLLAYLACDG